MQCLSQLKSWRLQVKLLIVSLAVNCVLLATLLRHHVDVSILFINAPNIADIGGVSDRESIGDAVEEKNSTLTFRSKESGKKKMDKNCESLVSEDNIGFLSDNNVSYPKQMRHPYTSYLMSYGGSGNTITRILLEYITNVWTGSIFDDEGLSSIGFKGEFVSCPEHSKNCNATPNMLVMKAHPEQLPLFKRKGRRTVDIDVMLKKHCLGFKRHRSCPLSIHSVSMVFVVRDPWKAMFTQYQYAFGDEEGLNEHVGHKLLSKWDPQHWTEWVEKQTLIWMLSHQLMTILDDRGDAYITVKYEHLLNINDPESVKMEFSKIFRFLYTDDYYTESEQMWMDRIDCIFPTLMRADYGRLGTMHRGLANASIHLTFDTAYQYLIDSRPEVVCRSWSKMKEIAKEYSYTMLAGVCCECLSHFDDNDTDTANGSLSVIIQNGSNLNCSQVIDENAIGFLCDDQLTFPEKIRHPNPSYLFSFGGSGSTIFRLMMEYITNVWTGSIYNDKKLFNYGFYGTLTSCHQNKMEGKKNDGPNVLLIKVSDRFYLQINRCIFPIIALIDNQRKAHPGHLNHILDDPSLMKEDCLALPPDKHEVELEWVYKNISDQSCDPYKRSPDIDIDISSTWNVSHVSAVFIVRDPWKALFTLYQYIYGDEAGKNKHVQRKMISSFNSNPNNFVRHVVGKADSWMKTFALMEAMEFEYVTVKYEDLVNVDDVDVVMREVEKVLRYLFSDGYYEEMIEIWMERVQCAVLHSMKRDYGRFGMIHRKPINASEHVTFEMAYNFLIENRPADGCKVWQRIKHEAVKYGYQNLPGLECTDDETE